MACDGSVSAEMAENCECDGVMDRITRDLDLPMFSVAPAGLPSDCALKNWADFEDFDSNTARIGKIKLSV
jgi:hypothetical protein